jgi:hypothetical protein
MTRIAKNSALCLKCNSIITSRFEAEHESCECGAIWIEGGHVKLIRGGDMAYFKDRSITVEDGDRCTVKEDVHD